MGPAGSIEADDATVAQVFREVYGQAVATLVSVFGDITLAEDAVQDAFVVASTRWATAGIPPNPAGWIVTTARNRAIDVVRRAVRGRQLEQEVGLSRAAPDRDLADVEEATAVGDDQLRLIFTCCHPALRLEHQVALTLRLLGGLSVAEVTRSFLVGEPAMAKRLVRAKYKIKAANIPYRIPRSAELPERLQAVLAVVYLIYNTGADDQNRAELRAEAIRLSRALVGLMPDEAEAAGLLALLLLAESRTASRRLDHKIVLLRDQDRSRWDRDLIAEGHTIMRACLRRDQPGPYQLQAAVQAVHCHAASIEETDWEQIVVLYDHLSSFTPTPVVALNRAVAIGEASGPAAALEALDAIGSELDGYHLMHAVRGTMLRRLGDSEGARAAFERAVESVATEAERVFLDAQIADLAG